MPMENAGNLREDLDSLKGDLNQLRGDVVGMAQNMFGRGKSELHAARDRATHAVGDLGERGKQVLSDVQHQVEQRPMAALGAALGVGFVLGMLLTGNHGHKR
ncbi:MAG: DUF883 family protein [Phycisphaerales bacterium]|nr:DUF883 family protein [Phycisphaerales bacterium]